MAAAGVAAAAHDAAAAADGGAGQVVQALLTWQTRAEAWRAQRCAGPDSGRPTHLSPCMAGSCASGSSWQAGEAWGAAEACLDTRLTEVSLPWFSCLQTAARP